MPRGSLPLVAVTGRAQSSLADSADIALILPPAKEACPMGLAPTTSTTMQIALGRCDRGGAAQPARLRTDRFSCVPPRRRLGSRLRRVRDLMLGPDALPLAARRRRWTRR